MPPTSCLQKRGIEEDIARSFVEDTVGCFPKTDTTVICGDWNTRIGDASPTVDDVKLVRQSVDKHTNARAPWLIDICEV